MKLTVKREHDKGSVKTTLPHNSFYINDVGDKRYFDPYDTRISPHFVLSKS